MDECKFGCTTCKCANCACNASKEGCDHGYCINCFECESNNDAMHNIYICTGFEPEPTVKANDEPTPPASDFDYVASILIEADKWGQLAEEAAELAQAALKMQRLSFFNTPRQTREECVKKVIEEHADLALCFKILGWDDKEERKQIMEQKIHRWAEHLKSKEL